MGDEARQSSVAVSTHARLGPRLELRLEAPLNAFRGKQAELNSVSTATVASAYYAADTLLKKALFYERAPREAWARLKNISLRLPLQLLAAYTNHELGHTKLHPLAGESDPTPPPFYLAAAFNGGRENSVLLANRLIDDVSMYGPDYSSALFYIVLKLDNFVQSIDLGSTISPWAIDDCPQCDTNDHVALRREIASERNSSRDYWGEIRDEDAGFSDIVTALGNGFHLFDPGFLWAFYQVAAGDGSPLPFYLPQFHYHETPYGPAFIVRGRIPLEKDAVTGFAGSMMTIGALATYNDYREESYGYEVGFKELAIPGTPLKFDTAHRGLVSPDTGYIADIEGMVRIPIFGEFSLDIGGRRKFGDGYLIGSQFIDGASVVVGFSLRRDVLE